MPNRFIRLAAGTVAILCVALTSTIGASAHDVHPFGKYTVALGWLHEPAYVGFENAVQVLVKDSAGNAVTDITDKDLTVEVSLGNQKMPAKALVPTADPDTGLGIPGEYEMHFIPTAPGSYTFHLKGAIKGQSIDETVSASDKAFNAVVGDDEVEFPNKVPATSDLATKIDRVGARLASDTAIVKDSANRSQFLGIAGIILALGLGGSVLALALRSRRT